MGSTEGLQGNIKGLGESERGIPRIPLIQYPSDHKHTRQCLARRLTFHVNSTSSRCAQVFILLSSHVLFIYLMDLPEPNMCPACCAHPQVPVPVQHYTVLPFPTIEIRTQGKPMGSNAVLCSLPFPKTIPFESRTSSTTTRRKVTSLSARWGNQPSRTT